MIKKGFMFKKLSKKKWIIIISICFILLIFKEVIENYINFERGAEDLADLGIEKIREIKNSIFKSALSPGSIKFDFMQIIGAYIPILIAIISFDYNSIKNKLLKFNIGKNNDYEKKLRKTKFNLALVFMINILIIFIILMSVGLIFGQLNSEFRLYDHNTFIQNSILNTIFGSELGFRNIYRTNNSFSRICSEVF